MEKTGKTHGKHREYTWSSQGKHREHTGKTQGLHIPTITALYRLVYFGKIKNTKKYTLNENIFIPSFAFHNFEQLLKHMENTGKTHGEHRENTWSPQGKHREHTGKSQGLRYEHTGHESAIKVLA